MIAITGAGGKTGRALVQALDRRGVAARAVVRSLTGSDELRALGAADVAQADFADVVRLAGTFAGAAAVYHICPNMHPAEVEIAGHVVEAARRAGVPRIVYHSVLHPQVEAMPHHWQKMRVEEMLFTAGLNYTILQPAAYMQNLLAYLPTVCGEGVYRVPYAAHTRLGMVDLGDVAAAAAVVLADPDHAGAGVSGRAALARRRGLGDHSVAVSGGARFPVCQSGSRAGGGGYGFNRRAGG